MPSYKEERIGEAFVLASAFLMGIFPVIINYTVNFVPAIFYAASSILLSTLFLFFYLWKEKQLAGLFKKEAWLIIIIVTIFVVILPSLCIFIGTKYTSSVNTALLAQVEIPVTFLICGFLFNEKLTWQKIIGGGIIMLGAITVLYNGSFSLNKGDLLIILGCIFYPVGNHYAKKALDFVHPSVVLFIRSFLGGLFLLIISLLFEKTGNSFWSLFSNNFFYIFINAFLVMFIAKSLWYEGLKRMEVTKAIPIIMTSPAFSLLFAIIFLQEIPNFYQLFGLIIILSGLFFLTKKKHPANHCLKDGI